MSAAGDIYRKAARLIESGALHTGEHNTKIKFSCCAIAEAEGIFPLWNYGKQGSDLVTQYRDLFDGEFGPDWQEESQNLRILALCFMAAIADSEEAR